MTTVSRVDVICSCCGAAFQATWVTSSYISKEQSTDFRGRASGEQPEWFVMNTCPACGFSAVAEDFERITPLTPPVQRSEEDREAIKRSLDRIRALDDNPNPKPHEHRVLSPELKAKILMELKPLVQERQPAPFERWEFAAKIASWDGASPELIGDLYLHAAWCAADWDFSTIELKYRRQAIAYFKLWLESADPADPARANITYLVGELYRRIGEGLSARSWFDRVMDEFSSDAAYQGVVTLAIQQRDNPKEFFDRT